MNKLKRPPLITIQGKVYLDQPDRGLLVNIEGIDGAGKSDQVKLVGDELVRRGVAIKLSREPRYDLRFGAEIQAVLKGQRSMHPLELQRLYADNRGDQYEKITKPNLQSGVSMLTDRSWCSSVAYGSSEGIPEDVLLAINETYPVPDLVIFLEVPADIALARCKKRAEELGLPLEKFESGEPLRRAAIAYRSLQARYPKAFKAVNGNRPKHAVTADIVELILKLAEGGVHGSTERAAAGAAI